MKTIRPETIHLADKCPLHHRCVHDYLFRCGEVEARIENKLLFVHCNHTAYCPYRMSFGNSIICSCPVFKERHFDSAHGKLSVK